MSIWANYAVFLIKIVTWVVAILLLVAGLVSIARKGKDHSKNKLVIKKLNKKFQDFSDTLNAELLDKKAYKILLKQTKAQQQITNLPARPRCFVLQFQGDIKASAVAALREEITAILQVATPADEVILLLESGGGLVSAYGLAASQLQRLRARKIPLTVCIDKVAASGGYLMACVADKIVAASFAIIGSIGVVAQVPNFHRLLKKKDIDVEQLTAGEYKRTLTIFGENTDKARAKFKAELEEIHQLFKDFIHDNRPTVNLQQVATGEYWLAAKALSFNLVDELITSDDYLAQATLRATVYTLHYSMKKTLIEKLGLGAQSLLNIGSGQQF